MSLSRAQDLRKFREAAAVELRTSQQSGAVPEIHGFPRETNVLEPAKLACVSGIAVTGPGSGPSEAAVSVPASGDWRMAKQVKALDESSASPSAGKGTEVPQARDDAQVMEARGRMLTQYGELRRRLAELMAEASSLGAEFQELSNQLRLCPNIVSIEGLIAPNSDKAPFAQSLFETRELVALVSEIRETIERKNDVQGRLQDLGILDAYGQFRY